MKPVVIVLWRPGDPWRERLWAFARTQWEAEGLRVIEADDPRGLFAARNTGARRVKWDVAVFADADIALAEPARIHGAIALAEGGGSYVAAFSELRALGRAATEAVLAGAPIADAEPEVVYPGSWVGAFAIARDFFDELGGYDERFAPYSGQDLAIVHAAATLGWLERVPGVAVHLWHERGGEQLGHPSQHPSLLEKYRAATGKPAEMRALLARAEAA